MLAGTAFGALASVSPWFDVDRRIWIVLLAAIGAGLLVAASMTFKSAIGAIPLRGWSISIALEFSTVSGIPSNKRRLALLTAWLTAAAMFLGGVLLGQAMSLFFSYTALR